METIDTTKPHPMFGASLSARGYFIAHPGEGGFHCEYLQRIRLAQ